jgi:5-formyltetrahydrofolate cyclo-ligase
MNSVQERKQALRKHIQTMKRSYSEKELNSFSVHAMQRLEATEVFQQAACVALYYPLQGEVDTTLLLERWYHKKCLLLPVVVGDDLIFRRYCGKSFMQVGAYGILEPMELEPMEVLPKIDLIVVPGVAFDKQLNRMGRGKGYYDKLLCDDASGVKLGLCFDFQLKEVVPVEPFDVAMDIVVTDQQVLTKY